MYYNTSIGNSSFLHALTAKERTSEQFSDSADLIVYALGYIRVGSPKRAHTRTHIILLIFRGTASSRKEKKGKKESERKNRKTVKRKKNTYRKKQDKIKDCNTEKRQKNRTKIQKNRKYDTRKDRSNEARNTNRKTRKQRWKIETKDKRK